MAAQFELRGLDGANPLGFLATLGVLVALHRRRERHARLRWVRRHTWVPVLEQVTAATEKHLACMIADGLRGRAVSKEAKQRREEARKAMDAAKTELKKKRDDIRQRPLTTAERREARDRELRPLEEELAALREQYARILLEAAPRVELALGKRIEDATREHYRQLAQGLMETTDVANRDELDQLAALGSDGCLDEDGQLRPTPFEFTHGSGHQFFLEDVRKLLDEITAERVHECLFQLWAYRDKGNSLRWDPFEDRRYALLDRDPSDEGARTVWMANLLGYRGLALLSAAPTWRGLGTVGWDDEQQTFTWPLWECFLSIDAVRSLVGLRELVTERPNAAALAARGVCAVFRAQCVKVGTGGNQKVNFSPARRVG